jgi:hypothetical protein
MPDGAVEHCLPRLNAYKYTLLSRAGTEQWSSHRDREERTYTQAGYNRSVRRNIDHRAGKNISSK